MQATRVVIRTDGGTRIGLGHMRRCLALAEALSRRGATVQFVLNNDADVATVVDESGFPLMRVDRSSDLEQTKGLLTRWDAQILVVDVYDPNATDWHEVGDQVDLLVVIDDLAACSLPVDVVVNSSIEAEELAYHVPFHARLLLGPCYALLRDEFAHVPQRPIRPSIQRVLITVGGSDPSHVTLRLLEWTRSALPEVTLVVVLGPFFPAPMRQAIERLSTQPDQRLMVAHDPATMKPLMLQADLAIAGGGQTAYELAATGTPAMAICMAENQQGNLQGLMRAGTLIAVGAVGDADLEETVIATLRRLNSDVAARNAMSTCGRQLVDGRGADRVAEALGTLIGQKRIGCR